MADNYVVEMLNITKVFPGIVANDNITLQLKRGEIHALLGENGAGKSTLMSVLFGLYQPEQGEIRIDGKRVEIRDPNDANTLHIGMVHQHFKLVECFTVLDNIILGVEPNKLGFLQKKEARKKVVALSEKYGLLVDPDALVEDITVGMQQRTEILKMLYRENEILIFDEPTNDLDIQTLSILEDYLDAFLQAGADLVNFHLESQGDLYSLIRRVKQAGKQAALTIKPATPAEALFPYLPLLDMVLVMSVEPGFGGQSFMADMMPKLAQLRAWIDERGLDCELEVDGGIDPVTARTAVENGAAVLVAGSAVYQAADIPGRIRELRG